ncbi:MAG: PBP1A family penicillin-binding protein, partial [Proteobacteria bacterium]|nr:PBP1A family penicillin-binding protein [Pseudomonadota bacterium]
MVKRSEKSSRVRKNKPAGPDKARNKSPPAPKRRWWATALRRTAVAFIWVMIGVGGLVAWYGYDLPDLEKLETPSRRPSITLLAADQSVLATYGDLHAGAVKFDDVPPYLIQAIVATEDRRFFDHSGIDVIGIIRAAFANLLAGGIRQGGSTLTQQLAKNLFLTPERSLKRKIQELLLAFWMEARFSKKQIFSIYLNRVYLGAGTYGVAAAARHYFGLPARALSLRQATVIAGLLKAPSRYSPFRDPKAATQRGDQVLDNMVATGFLDRADAKIASRAPLHLVPRGAGNSARYFSDWLLDRAAGFVGHSDRDLIVRTTLSPRLQRIGENQLSRTLTTSGRRLDVHQGALVSLAPDGAILAMVGGQSYAASQFNRVTQAVRQPGSAFKLFVYLAGLESGMTPDSAVFDTPVVVDGWRPRNYDGKYRGSVSLRAALAQSLNAAAVRISEQVGRRRVVAAAERLGITAPLKAHPSVALGVSEVSLMELTGAYAVLANRGYPAWPYGITEIRDGGGSLLYRRGGSGANRLVEPRIVAGLQSMLSEVIQSGTGRAARIRRPAAGKTGTSQDFRDAWFIGFSAELVTGVWLGNDDSTPMKKVTGGGLPARLWRGFMTEALEGSPA